MRSITIGWNPLGVITLCIAITLPMPMGYFSKYTGTVQICLAGCFAQNMVFAYTQALMTIASVNWEKLVNFYTLLLNQQPSSVIPNVYAEFQLPGLTLGVFQPEKYHTREFATSAKSKISLCLEVSNLEAAIAHVTN